MDVAQFKACVTCPATLDRVQVPSLSSSNGFTFPLLIYSNTNPNLITLLTLILGIKVPQTLSWTYKLNHRLYALSRCKRVCRCTKARCLIG
jgi:hypothetical protein